MLVSSIAPLFVKLPAEVKLLNPVVLSGSIRRTDAAVFVNGPLSAKVPLVMIVPWLSSPPLAEMLVCRRFTVP